MIVHGGGGEVHVTKGQQPYHLSTLSSALPPPPHIGFIQILRGWSGQSAKGDVLSLEVAMRILGRLFVFGHDTLG